MNDAQQKPFACTVKGCEMTFTNKDHLECHQKKHDMMLNLGLVNKNNDSADQTPTPTRFIRNCEEVGLFQDLQNVNPFDEIFKKATDIVKSGGTLDVAEANNSDDTLHTPHILPHIEGSKAKTAVCQTKQDATHRSCDFTLGGIYSDSTPENSLKSPEKDNNLTETVKDKIIKTLQNKEKLKNDKAVLASRFVSVVPFRDLTAEKRSDVINIDSGSENRSSTNETKEKIREMNRAAQTRCRKRKQIRLRQMEEEICSLREENKRLKVENELLKCQLLKDLGKNSKDVAPVPSRIIKQPDSQKQKKIAPSMSPALPIIIHIGPNITSPTIPVITKSPEPSSGKVNGQATTKDDRITKSAIVKKKFFRKIIPKIRIDKC
nr:uncharacterized protein LOC111512904 [Leptinotarsa decemlineata]